MTASCSACDVELVSDGADRACPSCGRLFAVAIVRRNAQPVFRDAPIVDLAPLVLPRPDWSRLYVRSDESESFAATVVAPAVTHTVLPTLLSVVGPLTFVLLLVAAPKAALALLVSAILARALRSSGPRRDAEQVSLDANALRIQMTDPTGEAFGLVTLPASDLSAVTHDESGVHVVRKDGTTVELWRGMNLPRDVRRYLAQNLAARLP